MPDQKRDLLQVCMKSVPGLPIPEFKQAFCDRCLQSECSRSLQADSRFEARVSTWYERLFEKPDQLPQDDPRFAQIKEKASKFIEITPERAVPILGRAQLRQPTSDWTDPRDLQAAPAERAPEPPRKVEPPKAPEVAPEVAPEEPPKPEPAPAQGPLQTSFQQGAMVGGAPPPSQKASEPVADPWAAPPSPEAPTTPGGQKVTVLKPGGTFRFGGGS